MESKSTIVDVAYKIALAVERLESVNRMDKYQLTQLHECCEAIDVLGVNFYKKALRLTGLRKAVLTEGIKLMTKKLNDKL